MKELVREPNGAWVKADVLDLTDKYGNTVFSIAGRMEQSVKAFGVEYRHIIVLSICLFVIFFIHFLILNLTSRGGRFILGILDMVLGIICFFQWNELTGFHGVFRMVEPYVLLALFSLLILYGIRLVVISMKGGHTW